MTVLKAMGSLQNRARMESVDKWMGKRGLSKKLRLRIGQHYQEVCVPALALALHRAADREYALAAWALHSELPELLA